MSQRMTIDFIKKNLKKQEVFPSVMVTPELANQLLELNTFNRPIRNRRVKHYSNQMKDGHWIFNGDSIRLSKSGVILDGQHRLLGVLDSKKPQVWNVITGLDDAAFQSIDTGANRSSGDMLASLGYKNSNVLAGCIRLIMMYDDGKLGTDSKALDTHQRISNGDIARWLEEKDEKQILECVHEANALYSKKKNILPPTLISGFMYLFGRKSIPQSREFFTLLITGEDISTKHFSPIYLLREKLIGWRGAYINPAERHATIIKAWNFYRAKEEIKLLKWQAREDFPKIK